MTPPRRIVICGAGAIGASVAYFLARRGAQPLVVDRARPGAAASGRAAGFLAADWNAGTRLDALTRASFALHRELAEELGAERLGYRPMDVLMTAAADEGDLERYRRLPNPDWLDGNVVAHEVIGGPETTAQVNPLQFTQTLLETAVERGATFARGIVDGMAFAGPEGAVSGVSIDGVHHPADRSGVLHAKCGLADREHLLVSSANLTESAMTNNIELGIVVRGGALPGQVADAFAELRQRGVLVPVG